MRWFALYKIKYGCAMVLQGVALVKNMVCHTDGICVAAALV
jgi:hypothetical protein